MSHVFISYASEQRDQAELLSDKLADQGYTVWWDRGLIPGDRYEQSLKEQIDAAYAVIAIWSDKSLNSDWCLSEIRRAHRAEKLIPVMVDNFDSENIPMPYDGVHAVPISDFSSVFSALENFSSGIKEVTYPDDLQLNDVFRIANPTITLVDRSKKPAFKEMLSNISRGGRVIRLHGPSKSGKTTLCRQAFKDRNKAAIHGRSINNLDEYYLELASECNLSNSSSQSEIERSILDNCTTILIDDFHAINRNTQKAIIRRVKRLLDGGITVVLISIPDCARELIEEDGELLFRSDEIKNTTLESKRATSNS